jgi:hypothetical protein
MSWYYLFLLIPLCLSVGLVVMRMRVVPAALTMAVVALFGYATEQPRAVMRTVDRQPVRQAVEAIRNFRPTALTGVFGVSDKQAESYDPNVVVLETEEQLDAMLNQAVQEQRAAFVYFAGDKESSIRSRTLYQRVAMSEDFQKWKTFKATEAMFSYQVYRCTAVGN